MTVPTTTGGEVGKGMTVRIDMWPTSDANANEAPAGVGDDNLDGDIRAAGYACENFPDNCYVGTGATQWQRFWDERETIDISITGRADALTLSGFDGAYLFGTTTT